MLRLEKVTITQGDFRLSADFAFPDGGITALIGPSGAGKSTLLSVLSGFFDAREGRIYFGEKEISSLVPAERPFAMLFQDNNLFPHLTIAQNVGLALRRQGRLTVSELAQVEEALTSVGLNGLSGRKPAALSGGQQSRAALARVLLQDKPIVLLDEPFSALGPALRTEMLDLVHGKVAQRGRSVIMVTHDPVDAKRVADHVVLVAEGKVYPPEPTEALFANPHPPDASRNSRISAA